MKRLYLPFTALLAAAALAFSVTASATPPSNVGQDEFFVVCQTSHAAPVDPILYPGNTMMSHLHQFFGNRGTNENSTPTTLRAAGTTSTCRTQDDRSAYWVPHAYLDGQLLPATHVSAYYTNWPKPSTGDSPKVTAFPFDTQMIAGNSKATAPLPTWQVRWSCGNANGVTAPAAATPYNCNPGTPSSKGDFSAAKGFDGLVASVFFPACRQDAATVVTTQGTTPTVKYYDQVSGLCPTGYTVKLVRLSVRIHYGVFDVVDNATGAIRLTLAGMVMNPDGTMTYVTDRPYYTIHADFMSGWNQTRLTNLVATCLNAAGHQSCSSIS